MAVRNPFTEADRARIADAVRAAESRSRGEIVAAVVPAADEYGGAVWRGAAFGAMLGPLLVTRVDLVSGAWSDPAPWMMVLAAAGGCAVGFLAVRSSAVLTRWLATDEEIELRVERAARTAFLEHEVFATRDRSGVLIFLSLLERRVMVLADSGIDAVVDPGAWSGIVDQIVRGIREGRPADALVEAIERCGELLDRAGLERREDDRDELDDALRLGDGLTDGGEDE